MENKKESKKAESVLESNISTQEMRQKITDPNVFLRILLETSLDIPHFKEYNFTIYAIGGCNYEVNGVSGDKNINIVVEWKQ